LGGKKKKYLSLRGRVRSDRKKKKKKPEGFDPETKPTLWAEGGRKRAVVQGNVQYSGPGWKGARKKKKPRDRA